MDDVRAGAVQVEQLRDQAGRVLKVRIHGDAYVLEAVVEPGKQRSLVTTASAHEEGGDTLLGANDFPNALLGVVGSRVDDEEQPGVVSRCDAIELIEDFSDEPREDLLLVEDGGDDEKALARRGVRFHESLRWECCRRSRANRI